MGFVVRRGTGQAPLLHPVHRRRRGEKMRKVPARTKVQTRLMEGRLGMEPKGPAAMVVELMDEWIATLANRNAADDRSRFKRHIRPAFEGMTLVQAAELGPIMKWIGEQRAARKVDEHGKKVEGLSDGSIRHNLNLLSRFFSWAIEQGHTQVNPVRMIPTGKRSRRRSGTSRG
jgi:hypothetical protein